MVDLAVWHTGVNTFRRFKCDFPKDMLEEIVERQAERANGATSASPLFARGETCRYHDHGPRSCYTIDW